MVENLQNIFMEHDLYLLDFWHKRKMDNFDSYNVLLAIATNIPVQFKSGFVVQGHIFYWTVLGNVFIEITLLYILQGKMYTYAVIRKILYIYFYHVVRNFSFLFILI